MPKSALILLDLQKGVIGRVEADAAYQQRVLSCMSAARAHKIPIIHVRTAFRPGHPEISSNNDTFKRVSSMGGFVEGSPDVEFAPPFTPAEGDIVVTKRRRGPFGTSDLDVVLRGLAVDSLVIGGIATGGAVLSTVRVAGDLDFELTVLEDLCLDPDEEVHRVLMQKVFVKQARVVQAQQWVEAQGDE